jgi:hypothetical protein
MYFRLLQVSHDVTYHDSRLNNAAQQSAMWQVIRNHYVTVRVFIVQIMTVIC